MANMEFGFGEGRLPAVRSSSNATCPKARSTCSSPTRRTVQERRLAQGQAMGVLAAKSRKTLLLTGTLMGGYGDDLFHLLFRALPGRMIEDGYRPTKSGSMTSAAMAFMRDHGVSRTSIPRAPARRTRRPRAPRYRCARSRRRVSVRRACCVAPAVLVFLKLKDIGGNVLPPYDEEFREVAMDTAQAAGLPRSGGVG